MDVIFLIFTIQLLWCDGWLLLGSSLGMETLPEMCQVVRWK